MNVVVMDYLIVSISLNLKLLIVFTWDQLMLLETMQARLDAELAAHHDFDGGDDDGPGTPMAASYNKARLFYFKKHIY